MLSLILEAASHLDLRSAAAAALCAQTSQGYTDLQWKRLAFGYATAEFWELAARRPAASSCPLPTWRAELKRLVLFDAFCNEELGKKMDMQEFVAMWQTQDSARKCKAACTSCEFCPEDTKQPLPKHPVVHVQTV